MAPTEDLWNGEEYLKVVLFGGKSIFFVNFTPVGILCLLNIDYCIVFVFFYIFLVLELSFTSELSKS